MSASGGESKICYVCFFSPGLTLKTIDNDQDSNFTLHVLDRPADKDPSEEMLPSPCLQIPDAIYKKKKQSMKEKGIGWVKEEGAKRVAKRAMNDALHWLTKSHIGPHGAAQLGLVGLPKTLEGHRAVPGMTHTALVSEEDAGHTPDQSSFRDFEAASPRPRHLGLDGERPEAARLAHPRSACVDDTTHQFDVTGDERLPGGLDDFGAAPDLFSGHSGFDMAEFSAFGGLDDADLLADGINNFDIF